MDIPHLGLGIGWGFPTLETENCGPLIICGVHTVLLIRIEYVLKPQSELTVHTQYVLASRRIEYVSGKAGQLKRIKLGV